MKEENIELTSKGIKKATACEPIRNLADIEKIKNLLNTKSKENTMFCSVPA